MADPRPKFPTADDLENLRTHVGFDLPLPPKLALQVLDLVDRLLQDTGPHCHVCGCTELFACDEGCGWALPGVCTNCVNTHTTKEPSDA
jgi:hypothetical protein